MARPSGIALVAASIRAGVADVVSPPFRGVALKSLGATLLIVVVLWAIGTRFFTHLAGETAGAHPLDVPFFLDGVFWIAGIFSGLALMIGLSFLIAPITAAIAGLFLDDVASAVEKAHYPADPPGRAIPLGESLREALRFTALSLLVNVACLVLLLLPGVNMIAFLIGNGWLIGKEYFGFAARRLMSEDEAKRLSTAWSGPAMLAGVAAAGVLMVPFVNFLAPLFAAATMVHLVKKTAAVSPRP